MEHIYRGLRSFGILTMLIFGGTFVFRWLLRGEASADQFIGFAVGLVCLLTALLVKRKAKRHTA
ncbi:hypothetical protein [Ectobacillus ponti]|uniref:Uncharacterized protein n=1 Tax=Ectobacillus ponti TaxID=2961894 RepID=A0AA41X942_9BACI|nr:hypothetical protein [Ectobacillus ponti]MCP8967651.1 hypothetical protein [Ectobacillus ponti]